MGHYSFQANDEDSRMESDSIGKRRVPRDAYFGVQTLRAYENFHITGLEMHRDIIISLAQIKKAAARINGRLHMIRPDVAEAIVRACDDIIDGKLHEYFIVDPIQGGAGTSLNMNANEVIANRAIEILGGPKGDYSIVHPNDDVNFGQSTNDVIPTAGKVTSIKLLRRAQKEITRLSEALEGKAKEFDGVIKMGRTQMQDAVPIRLGQEFSAYAQAVRRNIVRMEQAQEELCFVNLGGTAIGTGLNANSVYIQEVVPTLAELTGLPLKQADDLIDATQNVDAFVAASGAVKACAVTVCKIANDLRLLSSGPRAGFAEIVLPPRQNGSSIMPGKVNPVIPEVVNQVSFNIIGNDVTITMAAEAGQLELNAFEPIILYCLFQSIDTLRYAIETFIDNCILGIQVNRERCRELVEYSTGMATALCPLLGYKKAAEIAKQALKEDKSVRQILLEQGLMTQRQIEKTLNLYAMTVQQDDVVGRI